MITKRSSKKEIRDLQRLLVSLGYLDVPKKSDKGWWTKDTQRAVRKAYESLGWDHPRKGTWITTAALAALASSEHLHYLERDTTSGDAKRTSGGISYAGGSGSHAGAGTPYAGGSGSHAGGSGSHAGGSGSHAGGSGSHAGGSGSHAGGSGTHAG